jgi:hypothetical protein
VASPVAYQDAGRVMGELSLQEEECPTTTKSGSRLSNVDIRLTNVGSRIVPYHGGGRSKKINAWYLNTHMVYL